MIQDVIKKLASKVGKTKATSIYSYLFHLYYAQELLKGGETIAYDVGANMIKYNVTSDPKSKVRESESGNLEANPIEVRLPTSSQWNWNYLKKMPRTKEGSPPIQEFQGE